MADGITTFLFTANTKPAEDALDSFGEKVLGVAKTAGAVFAGYLTFKAIAGGIEKATVAAMESEKAVQQFNVALNLSGQYSEAASQSFQNYAHALQQTTGVSDELILQNASLLVSIGRLSGEGLEKATKAALDLAAGMQIDVATAFDIVAKAANGNVTALSKYGLEVSKSATDSEKLAAALRFIETRFGGTATAGLFTFEGALKGLRNAIGDVFEEIGKHIVKSPEIIALFRTISSQLIEFSKTVSSTNTIGLFGTLINASLAVAFAIASVVERTFSLIKAIGGVFNYFIYGVFGPITQGVGLIAGKIADLVSLVSDEAGGKFKAFAQGLTESGESMRNLAYGSFNEAGEQIKNVFAGVTENTGYATEAITNFSNKFAEESNRVAQNAKNSSAATNQAVQSTAKSTIQYGNLIVSAFSNTMQHLANNLAAGKNLFADFGTFVLNMLGDLAIQMGQMIMAAGFASAALKGFNAVGMIATGAALIAVGSLLKAFFGSKGGAGAGAAPVAGGGGGGFGGGAAQEMMTAQTPEEERAKATTGVQVVVQGNVFDSKETGLQIAKILNDSFDMSGTLVRATV